MSGHRRKLRRFRLIGLTGKAGSGKDSVADALVAKYGYAKYSFAQPLKELLNERFGWTMEMWADRLWKECPALHALDRNHIPIVGYSPRQLAQWLGTDILRRFAGPDVWVELMRQRVDKLEIQGVPGVVVADVRFDNEAVAIIARGGLVLHLTNPDAGAVAAHVSELGASEALVDGFFAARMGETAKLINDVINFLETGK